MIQNPVVDDKDALIEIEVIGKQLQLFVSDRGSEALVWLSVIQAKQLKDALNQALQDALNEVFKEADDEQ